MILFSFNILPHISYDYKYFSIVRESQYVRNDT